MEDVTLVNIEYVGGRVASYREVHFAPYYGLHFTLYGSKAQLDIEANHDTGEAWVEVTERYTRERKREQPSGDTGHGNADNDLLADSRPRLPRGREPLPACAPASRARQSPSAPATSIPAPSWTCPARRAP